MHIFDVQIFSGAAAVAQLGECQTEDLKAAGFSTEILILVQVPVEEKTDLVVKQMLGNSLNTFS